jgi:hypothetical protein
MALSALEPIHEAMAAGVSWPAADAVGGIWPLGT